MKNVFKGVVFAILLTQMALAKDVLIASASSDVDNIVAQLWIVTEADGSAKQLKITTNDGDAPSVYNASLIKKGVVIKKVDKYDVVVIKSDDFEVDRGGHFKMEFLSNGITGSKNHKELAIEFDGASWKLYHEGELATRFIFKGRKIFGKLVGISNVEIR